MLQLFRNIHDEDMEEKKPADDSVLEHILHIDLECPDQRSNVMISKCDSTEPLFSKCDH